MNIQYIPPSLSPHLCLPSYPVNQRFRSPPKCLEMLRKVNPKVCRRLSILLSLTIIHIALHLCVFDPSGKDNQSQSNSQGDASQVNGLQTEELTQLREEMEELRQQHTLLQAQLGDKDALIDTLVSEDTVNS